MSFNPGKSSVVVATLFRDNEAYIPYYLQCCQSMEESLPMFTFEYLFLTNNNSDRTAELLQTQTSLDNVKVRVEHFDDAHLSIPRVIRLAQYREMQLSDIRASSADYVILIDTEILFNGQMIKRLFKSFEEKQIDCITPFTINKIGLYHDTFALVDNDGVYMKPSENSLKTIWKRYVHNNDSSLLVEVQSAFAGIFICKRLHFENSSLTYLSDKRGCEHLIFNKSLRQMDLRIFVNNATTPITCQARDYSYYAQWLKTGETDFRGRISRIGNLLNLSAKDMKFELKKRLKIK
ncbi:MAG: hypothetical protein JXQ90_21460 [Cyclobacteriaceae bacterium]